MEHRAIAGWIHDQTGLDWWAQMVTVGYERIRGLREIGQRRGGLYEANKSRTFPVPVAQLFGAFADQGRRRQWLDRALTVRKATPDRSVRITMGNGTTVEVYLADKDTAKSSVQIQHRKLPSKTYGEDQGTA